MRLAKLYRKVKVTRKKNIVLNSNSDSAQTDRGLVVRSLVLLGWSVRAARSPRPLSVRPPSEHRSVVRHFF
jgi:hypothetical protein